MIERKVVLKEAANSCKLGGYGIIPPGAPGPGPYENLALNHFAAPDGTIVWSSPASARSRMVVMLPSGAHAKEAPSIDVALLGSGVLAQSAHRATVARALDATGMKHLRLLGPGAAVTTEDDDAPLRAGAQLSFLLGREAASSLVVAYLAPGAKSWVIVPSRADRGDTSGTLRAAIANAGLYALGRLEK